MQTMRRAMRILAMAFVMSVCAGSARGEATLYELTDGSNYQSGCFPPCLCPLLIQEDLRGTFRLEAVVLAGSYQRYNVTDVSWRSGSGEGLHVISGSGVYEVFSQFAQLHRLRLRLSIDGREPEAFDSGAVPGGDSISAIEIAISINGMFCFDTALGLVAKPVEPAALIPYSLAQPSGVLEGCFPPCECVLQDLGRLSGAFFVFALNSGGSSSSFAIESFRAFYADGFEGDGIVHVLGTGVLDLDLSTDPAMQRLTMLLRRNNGPIELFDSGSVPSTVDFPAIEAIVAKNGFFCFDTAITIASAP